MLRWMNTGTEALARLEKKIDDHAMDDTRQFEKLASSIDVHEANTATRHAQNQSFQTEIKSNQADINAKLGRLEGAIGTMDTLLPAIKIGIEQDQRRIYRQKMFRRIALAVVSTLVTVSALIPLAQMLVGLKISLHYGVGS